ncbi:MAG: arginine--tRNA ligase [Mycobacteriales bacterium]
MTPEDLAESIRAAVRRAVDSGALVVDVPTAITVERPKNRDHGDYATNLALQLAKAAGLPPRDVAAILKIEIERQPGITDVDIAGPGFLNLRLDQAAQGELARTVVAAGSAYGNNESAKGQRINLEFVSANPTGPIHIGGVRWAAVGDALARLLRASGADVTTEYYFNDAGEQITRFARSLYAAATGAPTPEGGYVGLYVSEIASDIVTAQPGVLDRPEEEALEVFRRSGTELMFAQIRESLAGFGVHFDVFFNEKSLHDKGELDAALERLTSQGHVYDADGATWLRTTDFGDDKDRVLRKSDGDWTYFAADCAYYLDKRERGFDKVVIMLGADHHGYVGRYKALVAAYGDDPNQNLEILIGQLVNLVKDGHPMKMSKRAGNVVSMEDLVDAVGVDAARYALARASADSMIDLDVDLLARQSNDNPVFYVQYAHARIASVLRNAGDLGISIGDVTAVDVALLAHERENDLLASLGEFPRVVAAGAELRQPHRVARYLEELAGVYHRFYDACRVLPRSDAVPTPDDESLTRARLLLCEATRTVLANGLALLGVTAPERM